MAGPEQQQRVRAGVRSKVAPKRSAAPDDASNGHLVNPASRMPSSASGAPKKRAVLTDRTNQQTRNASSSSSSSSSAFTKGVASKAAVNAKGRVRSTSQQSQMKERELDVVSAAPPDQKQQRKCTPHNTLTTSTSQRGCETIASTSSYLPPPKSANTNMCSEVIEIASDYSDSIASLERKTQTNLYISRDSSLRSSKQGCVSLDDGNNHDEICEHCLSKKYIDIDGNHKDPQMCSSYALDIYQHLRMDELKRRPLKEYMETVQEDINANMRGILVDWLIEVAEEYKLVPDTLYLTMSYIDRYLSGNVVTRQKLQLLGVSCMLIASKYEEICAPQVEEFCYITDNTYSREEVLEMERKVLNYLHFELTAPTVKSFLRRFIRAAQAGQKNPNPNNLQLEFLGNYLAELTLLEYSFLKYLPSMLAGSVVFIAKLTLNPTVRPWNSTLEHYTGYKASDLKECIKAIHELQCNKKNCTLPAIREKYRQHKFKCVATLVPPAVLPAEFFKDAVDGS